MFKKSVIYLIAMCMILTIVPIGSVVTVNAVYTHRAIDDFEEGNVGGVASSSGDYYASAIPEGEESGLLIKPKSSTWSSHVTVEPTMGYGGSAGLHMHADTSTVSSGKFRLAAIMTKAVTLTDTSAAVYRYRVKFTDVPTTYTGSLFYLSVLSENVASSKAAMTASGEAVGSKLNVSVGNWYTFVTKVTGSGTAKATESYILDDNGNVVYSTTKNITVSEANSPMYFWPVYIVGSAVAEPVRLVVDDISLTEYSTTDGVSVDTLGTNIADGDKGVMINSGFNLGFDQEISDTAADTVKIYKTQDAEKTAIAATVKNKTFNSFTIQPDDNLDLATEYTIDFSGVTSSAGTAIAGKNTINFKTYDPGEVPPEPVHIDAENSTLSDGQADVGLDDTFKLSFDSEILEPVAGVTVKLYKTADPSTLLDITISDFSGDSFKVTAANKLLLNTEYTLDLSGISTTLGGALEGTTSLSFKTIKSREPIYLTDDFEAESAALKGGDIISTSNTYVSIKESIGYEDSKGIHAINDAETGAGNVQITTKAFELDPSETLFLEYKVNFANMVDFDDNGNDGLYISLNGASFSKSIFRVTYDSNGWYISGHDGQYKHYYTPGEWYTLVWQVALDKMYGYVYNDAGELMVKIPYTGSRATAKNLTSPVTFYPMFRLDGTYVDVRFDNFKAYRVQTDSLKIDEAGSSVSNGETDVTVGKYIKLAFNQPVADLADTAEGASPVTLYKGETVVGASVRRGAGNEIWIAPTENLEDSTEYKIDFSGVTALSGSTLEGLTSVSFTTKNMYPAKVTSSSLAIAEDGAVSAGDITLSVNNNSGENIENAVIVVAIYGESRLSELKGIKMFKNQSIAAGESTLTLTLPESYNGVGGVEFLMYDSMANLLPLMRSYKITK